jgi:hypothetical protein
MPDRGMAEGAAGPHARSVVSNALGRVLYVVSGYREQVEAFLNSDPGLSGRFGPTVPVPSCSSAELEEILRRTFVPQDLLDA